jgi:electron transfer flavoprotein-quinone oxidoreductase
VGVGVLLRDLVRSRLSPHDLIEGMKAHPSIRPLLDGGLTEEYSAHLIPEGGWEAIPPLYRNGLLLAGDAAMLVNGLHREGSNMALTSGRLAAETALKAKETGDFSVGTLSAYQSALEESFVLQDLRRYRHIPDLLANHPHFFSLYPAVLNEAAQEILTVDGKSKGEKVGLIKKKLFQRLPRRAILKDLFHLWRAFR